MDTIFEIAFIDGKKIKVAAFNFSSAKAIAAYQRLTTEGAATHQQLAVDDEKCRLIGASTMCLIESDDLVLRSIYTGRALPHVPQPLRPGSIFIDPLDPPPPPPARNFTKFKEVQPMKQINCLCYRNGYCLHQAAPRAWFGKTVCIELVPPDDPRIKAGCALRCAHEKPKLEAPPPKRP